MTDSLKKPTAPSLSQSAGKAQGGRGRSIAKWLLITVAVLVVAYATIIRPLTQTSDMNRRGGYMKAMPVTADTVRKADLNVRIVALGTVVPVNTVTVRSRVDGQLQSLRFTEGQPVEAGSSLAEIDPRPFEVQKAQAEAQLAKDNALLENARLDLNRFTTLLSQDSISKQQVDTQAALVRQYEAAVKLDQAQVDTAALQITYAHIIAPISGRAGLRQVDLGNIIHASDSTGIVVLTQLKPITVVFSVPQDWLPRILKPFRAGDVMAVEAFDRDGKTLLAKGKLITVDNQIDTTTGTVKLRAEFPNADEALFPNQFVNVQLLVEQIPGATVVSNAAVQRGVQGTYVYVVTDQTTVNVRVIETGSTERGMTQVTKGLNPGETVVVDGVDKLKDGAQVELITKTEGPQAAPIAGGAGPEGAAQGKKKWDKDKKGSWNGSKAQKE